MEKQKHQTIDSTANVGLGLATPRSRFQPLFWFRAAIIIAITIATFRTIDSGISIVNSGGIFGLFGVPNAVYSVINIVDGVAYIAILVSIFKMHRTMAESSKSR